MHKIKVKCPAKINLTLEVLNKRQDGFHNIQSVMQTVDLFDVLTIKIEESQKFEIKLSGTSTEIPYNESNLVHKAIELFFKCNNLLTSNFSPFTISIHIEKNIPVSAGLAGGSTDAAGTIWGLNKIFDNIFSKEELHKMCAELGSDLNFCLEGGCMLATGRGEILEKLPFQEFRLSLVKPRDLGISAKEAYTKFSQLKNKPNLNMSAKFITALKSGENIVPFLYNDLEFALIGHYTELKEIKTLYPKAIMSGSGSAFFAIDESIKESKDFWAKNALKSINYGVCEG